MQQERDTSARISIDTKQKIEECRIVLGAEIRSIPTVDETINRAVEHYTRHLLEVQHAN